MVGDIVDWRRASLQEGAELLCSAQMEQDKNTLLMSDVRRPVAEKHVMNR